MVGDLDPRYDKRGGGGGGANYGWGFRPAIPQWGLGVGGGVHFRHNTKGRGGGGGGGELLSRRGEGTLHERATL